MNFLSITRLIPAKFLLAVGFAFNLLMSADAADDAKILVYTTTFAPYDFARAVGGDKIDLKMLLPPAVESHSFEPTPRDIIALQKCDLFIFGGGESDAWAEKILQSFKRKIRVISMLEVVTPVEEEIIEGMQDDESETPHQDEAQAESHHTEPEYDEHVWTSPRNAKQIVMAIRDALCEIDTANTAYYAQNAENYARQLDALDQAFADAVANGKRKVIVFGDRFPFRYFVDAYGLQYFAAFPGCATEVEPSAATIAFLITKIREEKIPVVFHIELSNEKIADAIAEATGAKKLQFHAVHNVSRDDFQNGVTYLDLMRQNLQNLIEALQ